ncbi:MAG: hypothetical protein IJR14_01785 [Synergistaceae bacterium]|nr:hypothetical protein [Synergistaceae bacterium]
MGKKAPEGFAELLRYSHMIAPEVMGLKDGGFLAGFWITGPDLESSTVQELEHLSAMMARAVNQLDVRWCIHFEFFRRESKNYPGGTFHETTTKLIDMERFAQFQQEEGHFESVQAMFVTYVPPVFEKSVAAQKMKKIVLGSEHESEEHIVEKQLERFEEVLRGLKDSLSLIVDIQRMKFHPDEGPDPYSGTSELLEAVNACVNGRWHPTRLPAFPYYLDCFLAKDCINGRLLEYDHEYVQCVSLVNYPSGTFPTILSALQALPVSFRWSNRFLLTDMREALGQIETKRRQWAQKIRSLVAQITGMETGRVNQDAVAMVEDLDDALQDAHSGEMAFGNHTSTVVLRHTDPEVLEEASREVVKVFERAGCNARLERMNNVEAFLGSLPGHGHENVRKPLITSFNFADLVPLSNDWIGEKDCPCPFYPPGSPALLQAATAGSTPFSLNLHTGDVGHTLILGPTGAGKSTLLATIAAQFQRYEGGQVFFFDNGRSIYPLCQALDDAVFYDLGGASDTIALCPLAQIDDPEVMAWAAEWLEMLVEMASPGLVTPGRRILLNDALKALAASTSCAAERTLTEYITSVQDEEIKAALGFYSLEQSGGHLLDGDHDDINYASFNVFEISALLGREKIAPAVLTYLFFQVQRRLRGAPSLLVVDEAWTAMRDKLFSEKIRAWLKTFRKLNCAVILATQSIADVVNSTIRDAVFESCPTKILLANPDAKGSKIGEFYRDYLQLNERQVDLISHMARKREYYVISPKGRRLFSLGLGPVALSFVGASGADDLARVRALKELHGRTWPAQWLRERELGDWADAWENVDRSMETEIWKQKEGAMIA